MTTPTERKPLQLTGLRANSFAAIVMLLIQFGLGMWVNLYGHIPAGDHGANAGTGFGKAISGGPAGLSIHAVLGIFLVISSVTAAVRAARTRRPALITATAAGLLAMIDAAISGASFVGSQSNAASMSMAIAAAAAIAAYALVLFLTATATATATGSTTAAGTAEQTASRRRPA
jgi:hypothetical protein